MLSEINQSQKDKYCMAPLIWNISSSKIQRNSRMLVTKGWGEGEKRSHSLMGIECQTCKIKKFWEVCFITMWIYLTLLTCTLKKKVKMVNVMLSVFTTIKKWNLHFKIFFIYFWERQRQSMSGQGEEREGHSESKAGSKLSDVSRVQHRAQTHKLRDHDLSWS